MTTPASQVERRVGQRFAFLLPVTFREISSGIEGRGVTQDVSSRGVFFFSDTLLHGPEIELTLNMPSEVTLGESMLVRCRGHILRVTTPGQKEIGSSAQGANEARFGIAVRLEGYEYLAQPSESSATLPRMSVLHGHHEEDELPRPRASRTVA